MSLTMDEATTAVMDILPIPDDLDVDKEDLHTTMRSEPTASHALAIADHPEKGAAQMPQNHGSIGDVTNLGWDGDESNVPKPVVGGLRNEELWLLLRRFNNQVHHLKETPHPARGSLDMNLAQEADYTPAELRSTLERLYVTVVVGVVKFGKHMIRLRSWKEKWRTSLFCIAYFAACLFDVLLPLFLIILLVLVAYPPLRPILFPPVPLALVHGTSGGVQKPATGDLGSTDSATGAPENYKGEAVEQEASNLVNGIANVALSSAAGKRDANFAGANDEEEREDDESPTAKDRGAKAGPDRTSLIAAEAADAKAVAQGGPLSKRHDKTKEPMEKAIFEAMGPMIYGMAEVSDTWERIGNALSPMPPFPKHLHRLRLAGLVLPILLGSFFITPYMISKVATFGIGFGFFGDPVIQRGVEWLNHTYPHWQKLLDLRNTLLKGIPTNAQVTITLLRIGEANHAPLPPVPRTSPLPPSQTTSNNSTEVAATEGDAPLGASETELQAAIAPSPTSSTEPPNETTNGKPQRASKLIGFFKGTTRATLSAAIGIDAAKAKAGSQHAKDRLGAIPASKTERKIGGPVQFKARYRGHKGRVVIVTHAVVPFVGFWAEKVAGQVAPAMMHGAEDTVRALAIWTVPIAEIAEIRKVGGYGWKGRLVVGWAFERNLKDGVEVVTREGENHRVTAMEMRDELFNRICAMGGQRWVIM